VGDGKPALGHTVILTWRGCSEAEGATRVAIEQNRWLYDHVEDAEEL
jgi:hypothetical protein